jgi:hypothetical protein
MSLRASSLARLASYSQHGSETCHTPFLCQNQVLIVCMTQDQMFHTYGQKGSQKTKYHNIKYNYYINIVFID